MKKVTGFTLVELMIVVAIMAILAGFAAPSFVDQIRQNRIDIVEKDLRQVVGRARGIALRNEHGYFGDELSVAVCFDANLLSLHEATSSAQASCDSDSIWEVDVEEDINIVSVTYPLDVQTKTDFEVMAINSKGAIVCAPGIECTNNFIITLNDDLESDEKVIY